MPEVPNLGDILRSLGRISERDVERALQYQQLNGCYFGEALVAQGILSADEIEFGLASQFDLPFIFPDAEAIDLDAAGLVSPEWALTHLTLPIMRVDDTLTVVVDSPLKAAPVEELQNRTGLSVELALAAPGRIRELIREVYARASAREEGESPIPCTLDEALALTSAAKANRFGISVRGRRAWFWYDDAGTVRRRTLDPHWERALDEVLVPPASGQIGKERRAVFSASMMREGVMTRTDVRYLADEAGREFLFRPMEKLDSIGDRFTPPGQAVHTEVRLLARTGAARFIVTSEPAELSREVLPHLPELFFDPSWRSVHIQGAEAEEDGVFSIHMPRDSHQWAHDLETLRAFHFDVVTVDLTDRPGEWASTAVDLASVAFILWEADRNPRIVIEAGILWKLHLVRTEGDHIEWSLEPLEG